MAPVIVLIPTADRRPSVAVVLVNLLEQAFTDFDVIVSDQSEDRSVSLDSIEIQTVVRALLYRGHRLALHYHPPRLGMTEQRQFLLDQSRPPFVHCLDDDVALDPFVVGNMARVPREEWRDFVGAAAVEMDFLEDVRPHQRRIELWAEPFAPETISWDRHPVNDAASALHLQQRLVRDGVVLRSKVAWVGGASVLYERKKLLTVGGFSLWDRLPPEHAGKEVVVQFPLIRRFGGCGVLPGDTYHLGPSANVPVRTRNATEQFGELIDEGKGRAGRGGMSSREGRPDDR